MYGNSESYGPYNGSTYGTPMEVYAECDVNTTYGWADSYVYVSTDPTDYSGADPGAITGKSTLLDWYPAAYTYAATGNPAQVSSQNFSAYDTAKQTVASVTGTQNTNNPSTSLNAGSFRITLRGRIYTYNSFGKNVKAISNEQGDSTDGYYYTGTMSCSAGGPHAYDLANAGYSPANEGYYGFAGQMDT